MRYARLTIAIIATLSLLVFLGGTVSAAPSDLRGGFATQLESAAGEDGANLGDVPAPLMAAYIIQGLLAVLGVVAIAYLVYAGSLYVTSGGGEERITKAKSIIRNAVIGLMLILSAYGITYMVVRIATGEQHKRGSKCIIEREQDGIENKFDQSVNDGQRPLDPCIYEEDLPYQLDQDGQIYEPGAPST